MRALTYRMLCAVLVVGMWGGISIAQTTDTTTATPPASQSDQGAGQDMKNAGHSTKKATKKTYHKSKKGVKKGTHKAAQKTSEGADKVQDKTAPDHQ
jgi:hypothetical protein